MLRWSELAGGGWGWDEVGERFSNTRKQIDLLLLLCERIHSNTLISLLCIKLRYTYLDYSLQFYLGHSYLAKSLDSTF